MGRVLHGMIKGGVAFCAALLLFTAGLVVQSSYDWVRAINAAARSILGRPPADAIQTAIPMNSQGGYKTYTDSEIANKWFNDRAQTAPEEVSCDDLARQSPLVIVSGGQSNAANRIPYPRVIKGNIYNFYFGKCYRAKSPLLGADAELGSVWMLLAENLATNAPERPILLAPTALSGSMISRWAPSGDLFYRLADTLDLLAQGGLPPTYLLWQQGESDAESGTSEAAYRHHLEAMIAGVRQRASRLPIVIARSSRCQMSYSEAVRNAQLKVVSPKENVLAGPDYDVLEYQFRFDNCHLNARGAEAIARDWASILSAYQAGRGAARANPP